MSKNSVLEELRLKDKDGFNKAKPIFWPQFLQD